MTHYLCTVEFRDRASGAIDHFVRELSASDGSIASEEIERAFLTEYAGDQRDVEIAEIVCMPEGNH